MFKLIIYFIDGFCNDHIILRINNTEVHWGSVTTKKGLVGPPLDLFQTIIPESDLKLSIALPFKEMSKSKTLNNICSEKVLILCSYDVGINIHVADPKEFSVY